jgi:rare lipoprotein A
MPTVPLGASRFSSRPVQSAARRTMLFGLAAALATVLSIWGKPAAADSAIPAQVGHASWYGEEFASRLTASGERFDPQKLTGAHRTLPLGSKVRVTNLRNGRSVLVTITDRGPFRSRREIDLSYSAARLLGMVRLGVIDVLIEPL